MAASTASPPSLIACVESYLCPLVPVGTSLVTTSSPALHILPTATLSKLKNLGPARAKDMRALGHARQIISHIPIVASPSMCTAVNDTLHGLVKMNAEKLSALAVLPVGSQEGDHSAKELQRCVGKLKFVGGVIGIRRNGGTVLHDKSYDGLWATAERYHVPILIRELWPTASDVWHKLSAYQSSFADTVLAPLGTHIYTAHDHSPLPIIHLYLSGVFDRHPDLRIILAHPGLIPSLLPRIESALLSIPATNKPRRGFLDVWQNNIYITTADVLDMSTMRTLLEQIPIDRVLYASNYPLEERGKDLMETLKESGFLTTEEYERLGWKNAQSLFSAGTTK